MDEINTEYWKKKYAIIDAAEIPIPEKIEQLIETLYEPNKSIYKYARILCYLSYRYLEGYVNIPRDLIEEEIDKNITKIHNEAYSGKLKATWPQSLEMVKGYLNLNKGNRILASASFINSIGSYDMVKNPGGLVNVVRACILLYFLYNDGNHLKNAECFFKSSVTSFPIFNVNPWMVQCITTASKSLEIVSAITTSQSKEDILSADLSEPYNKSISIVTENYQSEKWKYDEIYSKETQYGSTNHGKDAYKFLPKIIESLVDVGCGNNSFIKEINVIDKKIGTDISHPAADYKCDVCFLPFKNKEFEWLTSFDVLEHIVEYKIDQTLREFQRVAKNFCFSICYRDSGARASDGSTLHPTVKPEEWWIEKISQYGTVTKINQYLVGVFLNKH